MFMAYLKSIPLLLALLLVFIVQPVYCQPGNSPTTLSPGECILKLKESALVIRLNMKKRTGDAYKSQLTKNGISKEDSTGLVLKINELEQSRNQYKRLVKQSFSKFYRFSDVYFIENHRFKQMLGGGITELETVDGDLITSDQLIEYYVLINGYNDHNWIIKQADLSDMPNGFPDEYNSGFKRVINWAAGQSNINEKDLNKVAIKLNERLYKFYDKMKSEH